MFRDQKAFKVKNEFYNSSIFCTSSTKNFLFKKKLQKVKFKSHGLN